MTKLPFHIKTQAPDCTTTQVPLVRSGKKKTEEAVARSSPSLTDAPPRDPSHGSPDSRCLSACPRGCGNLPLARLHSPATILLCLVDPAATAASSSEAPPPLPDPAPPPRSPSPNPLDPATPRPHPGPRWRTSGVATHLVQRGLPGRLQRGDGGAVGSTPPPPPLGPQRAGRRPPQALNCTDTQIRIPVRDTAILRYAIFPKMQIRGYGNIHKK